MFEPRPDSNRRPRASGVRATRTGPLRRIGWTAFAVLAQLVGGQGLGFGVALALGLGGGWELVVIFAGSTVGVWATGSLLYPARRANRRVLGRSLVGSTGGSGLAMLVILTVPIGPLVLVAPTIGALIGFHLAWIAKPRGL